MSSGLLTDLLFYAAGLGKLRTAGNNVNMTFGWKAMFNAVEKAKGERVILHCDLNNFFASVAIKQEPRLRGKCVAVCGNPALRKGIVLAKSETAKKMGVKTGMAIWQAQQVCPDLVVVGTDYAAYTRYSKQVQSIYYRFTNQVESFGIDECWLDVTGSRKLFGAGLSIAYQICAAVKAETGLTISVGVADNKTYAKLGSDLAAPDTVVAITRDNYQRLIYPLSLNNLLFVGKKTQALLQKLNVKTIGELANYDVATLKTFIGINAEKLVAAARGADYSPVADYDTHEPPKSVGNGTTMPYDITTRQEVGQVLYLLAEKVAFRLRQAGYQGYTVTVSVKGTDLLWTGAQQSLTTPTNTVPTITNTALTIFDEIWGKGQKNVTPVRALRVAVSHLTDHAPMQVGLFADDNAEIKNQALADVFDRVRSKYGTEQIMLGGTADTYHHLGFKLDFYECDAVHDDGFIPE